MTVMDVGHDDPASFRMATCRERSASTIERRSPRLIVTGSRHASTRADEKDVIDALMIACGIVLADDGAFVHAAAIARVEGHPLSNDASDIPPMTLVHGACHLGGVDAIAERLARKWGWTIEAHPAIGHPSQDFGPWPGAGPRRNAYMIGLGADIVVGLPSGQSRGTMGCLELAIKAQMLTLVYPLRTDARLRRTTRE